MSEGLKLSDYVTTEAVHAAFAGAADVAKAGGEATLRYVAIEAASTACIAAVAFGVFTVLAIVAIVAIARSDQFPGFQEKSLAVLFTILFTLAPLMAAGQALIRAVPRAMEPAGYIIHDYLIGRAGR